MAYHRVVFDEIEKNNILTPRLDGRVQRIATFLFEHLKEQRGRHVSKVVAGEVLPVVAYELVAVRF